ncbi:MAG: hypothetical protein GY874_14045 [Desulfobacteraceae bacterium]|nr:hypothetical protein [Desulfobacteraceae bacterium]
MKNFSLIKNFGILTLSMLIIALVAYDSGYSHINSGEKKAADTGANNTVSLTVAAHLQNTLMAIATVDVSSNASVYIEFTADSVKTRYTAVYENAMLHQIVVFGMRAETTYSMQAIAIFDNGSTAQSEQVDFTTGSLPSTAPETQVVTSDKRSFGGITFFGNRIKLSGKVKNEPAYYGVDEEGEIVWYLHGAEAVTSSLNLRKIEPGVLMVFFKNSVRTITPTGETIADYDLSSIGNYHHEAILLPNANIMVLANERGSFNGKTLAGDKIYEIDPDGNVVWEWSSFDHLDTSRFPGQLSQSPALGGQNALDWTHCNALFYIKDEQAILLSSRSQSWVIKIDHNTGYISWILGDDAHIANDFDEAFFTLDGSGAWMTAQHASTITSDGKILIYDNRNESGGPILNSRAVKYALDESAMTAVQTWEAIAPVYTFALGDVDELPNGNVLMCAGGPSGPKPETLPIVEAHIVEVSADESATVLWELIVSNNVYRAERISWDDFLVMPVQE